MNAIIIVVLLLVCGGAYDCKNVGHERKSGFVENEILRDDSKSGGDDSIRHDVYNDNDNEELPIEDQVKVLTKQLNALMNRRRDDFQQMENNLKKSLKITAQAEYVDMDIRNEMEQLRHEIKTLREERNQNKEQLTIEWMSQSIAQLRKELIEVREISLNASREINEHRIQRKDVDELKLEVKLIKESQQTNSLLIQELRDEFQQNEDENQRTFIRLQHHSDNKDSKEDDGEENSQNSIEADHKRRHNRFIRQQLHDLEMSHRHIKRKLNELQYHHIGDRIHNMEIEQRRLANANFNLSRQIANLDKLHSSMMELLENVEGIQSKIDKTVPELRGEIAKLEFTSAQLNTEQSLIREEGHNVAKSVQAVAVSVSTLQNERDNIKEMQTSIENLQRDVEQLKSLTEIQKSLTQKQIREIEIEAKLKSNGMNVESDSDIFHSSSNNGSKLEMTNNLVRDLEHIELEYEAIINKLPSDCSQVELGNNNRTGLYLIVPTGQQHPIISHCSNGWTTIQNRYDGSVDFNRSWDSYGQGFGTPSGEHWIGNDILHHLTSDNCTKLKIIMKDIYENTWQAEYNHFYISSRDDGYRLHLSGYKGNASDALDYQNGMQFSAIDVDRDISNTHCAANYEGGWWFSHCQHANLNGRYNLGLTWFDAARNEWIAVKSSQMLIAKREKCYEDDELTNKSTTVISNENGSSV